MTTIQRPLPARPVVRAKARAGDALPTFPDAQAYRNHVVKLVGQAIALDRELTAEARRGGAGERLQALNDRKDAIRLQLAVLRDHFAIPAAWARPELAFGENFDKDAFWREQDHALARGVAAPAAPIMPAAAPARRRFADALAKACGNGGTILHATIPALFLGGICAIFSIPFGVPGLVVVGVGTAIAAGVSGAIAFGRL